VYIVISGKLFHKRPSHWREKLSSGAYDLSTGPLNGTSTQPTQPDEKESGEVLKSGMFCGTDLEGENLDQ
jgi:hypothetical protein